MPDSLLRNKGFAGTAFLLDGTDGLAMTAAHVAEQLTLREAAVLLRGTDGHRQPAVVRGIEIHPTQNVALLRLEPGTYLSPLLLSYHQEYT
ncbi:hypothetical protein [Streptomyces sp. NBC_00370]|uniref:hypothetical protein n=1 Tax=Streptomyces sp. NBC_00370 TaxID=2975728 RepID=UPI002E274A34